MIKWIVVNKTVPENKTPEYSWPDAKFYSEEEAQAVIEKRKTINPQLNYVALKIESDEL